MLAVAVIAAGLYFLLRGGSAPAGRSRGLGKVPVVTTNVTRGDIGVYLTGLGSVTPLYSVLIKPRVDGQLMKVNFTEGDFVHEGDLLVQIDPRPFEVQVAQAEGQVVRDAALLKNARLDLERYKGLWARDAIPQQTLSTQEATVAQAEGTLTSDQAQLDNAKLNLTYSRITAPISGRVGLRLVDAGNMVHATDTGGLVSIAQVEPITATFTIPEDYLVAILKKLRHGDKLPVEAFDREQRNRLAGGSLLTIDNQIDPTTGTLKCKAIFTNDDGLLFPNQFVNIRLLLEMKHGITLVSAAAIQRGAEQSTFVYLVGTKKDANGAPVSSVSVRPVTLGTAEGDSIEVTSGLKSGDVVVLEGIDRLEDGSQVTPSTKAESTAVKPASPKAAHAKS